ncbi:MAG TPA: hypothetical protein VFZ23_03710 [Pyrinomonadaceae bacterium]
MWTAYFRRIFAAAFLVFLLAEWGSHGLAFAHSASTKGQMVFSEENGHEDPCKTMVNCPDGRRQDQKAPNSGHHTSQQNAFSGYLPHPRGLDGSMKDSLLPREKIRRLFRSPSPPFHPPELS